MMVYSIIATMLFIYSGVGAATMAAYNIMIACWVVTANLIYVTVGIGVICSAEAGIPFIGIPISTSCWLGPFLTSMILSIAAIATSAAFTSYFYMMRTLAIILGLTGSWKTNTL